MLKKIHSDQKSGIPIGNPQFRSEFQPSDRDKIALILFFGIFIKIKHIYLVSDWSKNKIMDFFN